MASGVGHWEAYYRGGGLATCPMAADGSYDGEVREAWERFFSLLPQSAALLDVCTGNGVIPLLAKAFADEQGHSFAIHGADLAAIAPQRDVADGRRRFDGIEFHPNVATEALPFPAASYDAVTGQYALEYTDVNAALAEIRRVLRPGGHAQFILHHRDSILVRNAHESLEQAALVRSETRVYPLLRRLIAAEREDPQRAAEAAAELNGAAATLHAALGRARSPLILHVTLDALRKLWELRVRLSPDDLSAEIDKVENELQASVERLEDLAGHALSEADMEALAGRAAGIGLAIAEMTPQYHAGENLVGWRLRLIRQPDEADTNRVE